MALDSVTRVFTFELRRALRDQLTWLAIAAFALLLAAGAWLHWQMLPPRPDGGRLFGEAYLLGLAILYHTGIARDRTHHFDRYLAANFVSPDVLYVGKVAATVLFVFGFAIVTFGLALITSLGDMAYAAHYSLLFLLASVLILPMLVLTELMVTTRFPVPLILIAFFAFLAVYGRTSDLQPLLDSLGFGGQIELWPALLRTTLAIAATLACYPLYRSKLGGPHLATGDSAP